MNLIWSDLHINHEAILRYENRPFKDVKEMKQVLTGNWKSAATSHDTVFVLGDVAFRTTKEELTEIIQNLPGKKVLVMGNHDKSKSLRWWHDVGFAEVYKYPIIYRDWFILSHEPVYVGPEMPYVNIHGHTHGESSTNPRKVNVCVEATDYKPASLDGIIARFTKQQKRTEKL